MMALPSAIIEKNEKSRSLCVDATCGAFPRINSTCRKATSRLAVNTTEGMASRPSSRGTGVTSPACDRKAVQLEVPKSIPIDATAKPFPGLMIKNGAALTDQAAEPIMHMSMAGANPMSRKPPQMAKQTTQKIKATRRWPLFFKLARPEGFEPPTPWFVAKYSIQMSYGRVERREL